MNKFPNMKAALIQAVESGDPDRIEVTLLTIVDKVARQCCDEMKSFSLDDIKDIDPFPKYETGQSPRSLIEANEMLDEGVLFLTGGWKIARISKFVGKEETVINVLYNCGDAINSNDHLGVLAHDEGIDEQWRGWVFQPHKRLF